MSKFKAQSPVVHIPSFTAHEIGVADLHHLLNGVKAELSIGFLDSWYYYTDLEGWGKVLWDLAFNSNLYKSDSFDCDNYAFKAMSRCAEIYGLNTLAVVIGDIPQGRHAFNMLFHGDGFMLWEPNAGFSYAGTPFEIGENGYIVDKVIM